MFERFSDRARTCMGRARQAAMRLGHDYMGTEHILLGLLRTEGVAQVALRNLMVDLNQIREIIQGLVASGSCSEKGPLPFTPRAKNVLDYSLEEAKNLGHRYIGTEHLLLGLIRESDGIGYVALRKAHVQYDDVRNRVLDLLGTIVDDSASDAAQDALLDVERRDARWHEHVFQSDFSLEKKGARVLQKRIQTLDETVETLRLEVARLHERLDEQSDKA